MVHLQDFDHDFEVDGQKNDRRNIILVNVMTTVVCITMLKIAFVRAGLSKY